MKIPQKLLEPFAGVEKRAKVIAAIIKRKNTWKRKKG